MNGRKTIRGRFVLPVDGPPIPGGSVTLQDGRIVEVGSTPGDDVEDLGNVAICPGLINAHVHWEFSRLSAPLGEPGTSLLDWIPRILAYRRETGCANDREALRLGMAESFRSGTAAAGEITQPGSSLDVLMNGPPETVAFLELIGPTVDRAKTALAAAEAWIAEAQSHGWIGRIGLSPHAPYTVHPALLEGALRLARRWNLPLAMHYAESAEERIFLDEGAGPFRAMLERLGAWSVELAPRGDILNILSGAPRALIVHGTYLSAAETAFLAARRETMSVVYCPRSTARFHSRPYPLSRFLCAGVHVALGTDGRASAPNLDMLDEMRFLAARHPDISPETILNLATLAGAQALGVEGEFGSLARGKRGAPAVVRLPEQSGEAHALILAEGHCIPWA